MVWEVMGSNQAIYKLKLVLAALGIALRFMRYS